MILATLLRCYSCDGCVDPFYPSLEHIQDCRPADHQDSRIDNHAAEESNAAGRPIMNLVEDQRPPACVKIIAQDGRYGGIRTALLFDRIHASMSLICHWKTACETATAWLTELKTSFEPSKELRYYLYIQNKGLSDTLFNQKQLPPKKNPCWSPSGPHWAPPLM